MSCGIGVSRPRQLFRFNAMRKGPLLPHGLTTLGGGRAPFRTSNLHHQKQTGGGDAAIFADAEGVSVTVTIPVQPLTGATQ